MKASTTVSLGGDLPVSRIGLGTRWFAGPDSWGPPVDPAATHAVARRAVELGVRFFDTADTYGPAVAESVLAEALHPYADGVVIGTKAGMARPSVGEWIPLGRPEYLRQQVELSLRALRLDTIDLFQLHRIDESVPLADQIGALKDLQEAGKIRHLGLCVVTVPQIEEVRRITEIVSVQNRYHLKDRASDDVVDYCEREGLTFIPFLPIGKGAHAVTEGPLADVAKELGATPPQVALAWLLHRSPAILPIPGTSSLTHLEENVRAAELELSDQQFKDLSELS